MKKLFLFAIVALAVVVIAAPQAQAQTIGLTTRAGATCNTPATARDHAASDVMGGVAMEMCYHLRTEVGGSDDGAGAIETNHGTPSGSLLGSGITDFPFSNTDGSVKGDGGNSISRTDAGCAVAIGTGSVTDYAGRNNIGNRYVRASAFVLNGTNGLTATAYTTAGAATATDAVLGIMYTGLARTNSGTGVNTLTVVHAGDFTPYLVGHPAQAGSLKVSNYGPVAEGAKANFIRLEFPNSIMPGTSGTASNSTLVNVKYGTRIYKSMVNPATTVAGDFALATNTVINPGNATVRWDGTTPNGTYTGLSPYGAKNHYFNDFTVDAGVTPNVNYIAVPVLKGDDAKGGTFDTTNGVPLMFVGSWGVQGQNSGAGGGLPTPVRVTSFSSSFDPKTGKVSLNWRTSTEDDLSGFNIWRDTTVNGKPLGQRTFVAFVQAKTGLANVGADYSYSDTIDMSKYQRIARGKPINVAYSIEEVSLEGALTPAGTTSLTVSPKLAGTAVR